MSIGVADQVAKRQEFRDGVTCYFKEVEFCVDVAGGSNEFSVWVRDGINE